MTIIRVQLPCCPVCEKDKARLFTLKAYGDTLYFLMCDPARGGCGVRTFDHDNVGGALCAWANSAPHELARQERIAA